MDRRKSSIIRMLEEYISLNIVLFIVITFFIIHPYIYKNIVQFYNIEKKGTNSFQYRK
jgi:hypothetical protein